MSDFVLKIHLFDDTYQSHQEAIDVNMNIDLPLYIVDDRSVRSQPVTYELKGRSINHLLQVEVHYAETSASFIAVRLSYLLSPPTPVQGVLSSIQTPYQITAVDPAMYSIDAVGWIPMDGSPESKPECHCDMRALMSAPHPEGCAWLKWKRAQPRNQA